MKNKAIEARIALNTVLLSGLLIIFVFLTIILIEGATEKDFNGESDDVYSFISGNLKNGDYDDVCDEVHRYAFDNHEYDRFWEFANAYEACQRYKIWRVYNMRINDGAEYTFITNEEAATRLENNKNTVFDIYQNCSFPENQYLLENMASEVSK